MTLIRASFADRAIRSFDSQEADDPRLVADDPRDRELVRLQAELDQTRAALALLQKDLKQQVAAAEAAALAVAMAERTDFEAAQAERLEHALAEAVKRLSERLSALEPVAVLVAGTVLDEIFGSAEWAQAHLAAAVHHRLERLGSEASPTVRVSAEDCPEGVIEQSLGGEVVIDPALAKGEVRLTLRLGEIDISPDSQWQQASERLRHYLDEVLDAG